MRFMMLLPAPVEVLEKCAIPDQELVLAMHKYNDEMKKAGVLLSAEGLHPTSKGTRLRIASGKPVITDGPFAEAKEVIAGFWIIQVTSKQEAIEWAKRCPLPEHGLIEIRQIFENAEFPPELREKHKDAGA
jgi:hypothetical protein